MNKISKLTKVLSIGLTTLSLAACMSNNSDSTSSSWLNNDRRTATAIVDDQAITSKVNIALTKNKAMWKESHISIMSYNNSLLLVGQTKNRIYKDQLEKILEPITGINNIYNQVTVGEPIPLKARANDTWITTQAKAKIVTNRNIGTNRVKVITEDSVVYLMGMLTKDEEQVVTSLVRRIPGVERVVTVIEPSEENR